MKEIISIGDKVVTTDGLEGIVTEITTKSFHWKPIKVLIQKGYLKGLTLSYSKKDVNVKT